MYWLRPVLIPLVLAIFFTFCLTPIIDRALEEKKYDEAIKAHQRAVDADPYDPAFARDLAIAYRGAGRYKQAIPIYIKALELGDGGPPDLLFDLASCYEKVGNTEMAIKTFERYIRAVKKSDPDSADRAERAVENIKKR